MARGDSINSLLQMQAYRRAEMEGMIAKRDVYGETKAFVEQWRKNNGLEGTKALPNRNEVPFQWMIPFLDKVETDDTKPSPLANQGMLIAGGKKSDEQRAYEDFVRDSGSQPLDEQLMDMDKGRMGGGLDILDDLLFNDTV
tara:strand:+ start:156 stop:578 length:423 start_codon:yes stop_codon:yes gene_type:complete